MSNSFYYVDIDTGKFAGIYDSLQNNPLIALVDSRPPNALHRWDFNNSTWIALSESEIVADSEPILQEEYYPSLQPSLQTVPNSVILWGDSKGTKLLNSNLIVDSNTFNVPNFINISEDKDYLINNRSITKKYYQKIKLTNQAQSNDRSWRLIDGMSLVTENTYPIFAEIKIELIAKTSKNNKDFLFGLYINQQQIVDESLDVDFKAANDDKFINWSDEFIINPNTLIELKWARVGSQNFYCRCDRRLLRIKEL